MTVSPASAPNLAGKDEHVHSLLTRAGEELTTAAHFLSEYNISTKLAQTAASLLDEPLIGLYKVQETVQESASKYLNSLVLSYIKSVAAEATVTGLWRVQQSDSDYTLEYTIALRDNTLDNRALFREFRLDYEESGFGTLVPLVFHLIPESLSSDVIMSDEVAFA